MRDSTGALFVDTTGPTFERQDVGQDVVLLCRGLPIASFSRGDSIARDVAIAALIRVGGGLKTDTIAKLCDASHGWVCAVRKRLTEGGLQGVLERAPRGPERKLVGAKKRRLCQLHADGGSVRQIAKKLGVSKSLVSSKIKLLRLPPRGWRKAQGALPLATMTAAPQLPCLTVAEGSAALDAVAASPAADSSDVMTSEDVETTLTMLETIAEPEEPSDEAPASSTELAAGVPLENGPVEHPCRYAGTLLLCSAAIMLGVFSAINAASVIRPSEAVYDAHQVFTALMAAWGAGYGSLEAMHERDARALGVILGLERSPSVRTLHRAIAQMSATFDPVELDAALMRGVLSARLPEQLWFGVDIHLGAVPNLHLITPIQAAARASWVTVGSG